MRGFNLSPAIVTLLVLTASGQVIEHLESNTIYPANAPYEDHRRTTLINRVVDAETGLPIPGATMTVLGDEDFPTPGSILVLGRAEADADGWVRLGDDPLGGASCCWVIFEAPGYSPIGVHMFHGDYPMELHKGHNAQLRVVDPSGRPLPGMDVELLLGCGHDGASRAVKTDERGIAVLHDVSTDIPTAELWIRGPGVLSRYHHWDPADNEDEVRDIVVQLTPDIRGQVVDEEGKPVVGAHVGRMNCKRGPWVKTDDEGRFVLTGLGEDSFEVHAPGSGWPSPDVNEVLLPPLDLPLRITLTKDGKLVTPPDVRTLEVLIPDFLKTHPLWRLKFVRESDGYTKFVETTTEETKVRLPAGDSWFLLHGRDEHETIEHRLTEAELKTGRVILAYPGSPSADDEREEEIEVDELLELSHRRARPELNNGRLVTVRIGFPRNELGEVTLLAKNYRRDLTPHLAWLERKGPEDDPEGLPRDWYGVEVELGNLIGVQLVTSPGGQETFIAPDQTEIEVRPWLQVLRLPQPRNAEGEVVSCSYAYFHEPVALEDLDDFYFEETLPSEDPATIVRTSSGSSWLCLRAEDEELAPIWIDLRELDPAPGYRDIGSDVDGAALRFEALTFPSLSELPIVVTWPDHEEVEGLSLDVAVKDVLAAYLEVGDQIDLSDVDRPDLLTKTLKARLHMSDGSIDRFPSLRFKIAEGETTRLSWPRTILDLRFRHTVMDSEDPSSVTVIVDGEEIARYHGDDHLRIHGLAPGRHQLIVAGPGLKSHRIVFELKETLEIDLEMHPLDD